MKMGNLVKKARLRSGYEPAPIEDDGGSLVSNARARAHSRPADSDGDSSREFQSRISDLQARLNEATDELAVKSEALKTATAALAGANSEMKTTRILHLKSVFAARGQTFNEYAPDTRQLLELPVEQFFAVMQMASREPIPQSQRFEDSNLVQAARLRKVPF
jgi:Tfp pilus assembly protein FimV